MAGPMAIVGAGASLVGGILGAQGAEYQGAAQANMYNYQAGVAQLNAQIAKQDANYSLAGGEVAAEQAGMRTAAEVGATRAGFGASNIAGASKNAVISSEVEVGAQNQGIIRANAAKRAYGFEVGAAEDVAQAGADVAAASTSRVAGDIGATSSILGAVGSVASKWSQASTSFGLGGGT